MRGWGKEVGQPPAARPRRCRTVTILRTKVRFSLFSNYNYTVYFGITHMEYLDLIFPRIFILKVFLVFPISATVLDHEVRFGVFYNGHLVNILRRIGFQ